MVDSDSAAFGYSLRTHRTQLGWSASQLSELYAEFAGREDSPPNVAFIYHIEKGTTAVKREKRAILASLVGMPLALAGMAELSPSTPVDVAEYMQALAVYCDHIYRREGTLRPEREAIGTRINHLGTAVWQASGAEKRRLLELLGFYHIIYAQSWMGQQPVIAYALLSSPIETAKQEKFPVLLVYALIQRAELAMGRFEATDNSEVLQSAMRDINAVVAGNEQEKFPVLYAGLLDVVHGRLCAYMACDRQAFTAALHLITKGSRQIGESDGDQRIIARLDEEYSMLARASAYLYASMGDAQLGLRQLQELERKYPEAGGKHRLVQRDQLWVLAYLAIGDYPMAAAHLEAAAENAPKDCIDDLIQLHTRLKNTSYGNDPEVGRIAVKIYRIKYPALFL